MTFTTVRECRGCQNPDLLRDRSRNVTRAELCGECLFKRSQLRGLGPIELICSRPGCNKPVRRFQSQMGKFKNNYCSQQCMGQGMSEIAAAKPKKTCFCGEKLRAKGLCHQHYRIFTGRTKGSGPWNGYIKLLFAENATANAKAQKANKAKANTNAINAVVAQYGQVALDALKAVQEDQQME